MYSPRVAIVNASGVAINVMPLDPKFKEMRDHLIIPLGDDEYCAPGWKLIDGKFQKVNYCP